MKEYSFWGLLWKLSKQLISEWLLLTFALLTLLNFMAIWANPEHVIFIGETNPVILIAEMVFVILAVSWGGISICRKLKHGWRKNNENERHSNL